MDQDVRPGLASAAAVAWPIPLDAPVTSAVLFWSEVIVISLAFQIADNTGTETVADGRADSVRSSALNQVNRSKTESRVQRRAPGTCGSRRDWSRGR